MTLLNAIGCDKPRWRDAIEVMPLSLDQYHRIIEANILPPGTPVEFLEGYIVSKDRGMGFDWPHPMMPLDVPRLYGEAPVWPFSVEQYQRLISAGVIEEGAPIELLEGYLVAKDRGGGSGMGHKPAHASGVRILQDTVRAALPLHVMVQSQLPITLPPSDLQPGGSEPEPDLTVAQGPRNRYADHHPGPQEIRLLGEVADSSLRLDRRAKAGLYAAAGIVLYWIINLQDRQVEVFSDPDVTLRQYRAHEVLDENQQIVLTAPDFGPITFQVRDLLP